MIIVNASLCPQNHRCPTLRVCPTGALQQEGFNAPFIDQEECIECGRCTYSCPVFSQVTENPATRGNGHSARGNDRATSTEGFGGLEHHFRR